MTNKRPSFSICIKMMRSKDPQTQEDGFHCLLPQASAFVNELIKEFNEVQNDLGLKCWLMELIAEAKHEDAFEFLARFARDEDSSVRSWAREGLKYLDTKEARSVL